MPDIERDRLEVHDSNLETISLNDEPNLGLKVTDQRRRVTWNDVLRKVNESTQTYFDNPAPFPMQEGTSLFVSIAIQQFQTDRPNWTI